MVYRIIVILLATLGQLLPLRHFKLILPAVYRDLLDIHGSSSKGTVGLVKPARLCPGERSLFWRCRLEATALYCRRN